MRPFFFPVLFICTVILFGQNGTAAEILRPVAVVRTPEAFPSPIGDYVAEKAFDGDPETCCCLLDASRNGSDKDTIPIGAAAPVEGELVVDLGKTTEISGLILQARKNNGVYLPKTIDILAYPGERFDGRSEPVVLSENVAIPPEKNGGFVVLSWKKSSARFVGIRVREGYESGPKHFNFQIAELAFFNGPTPEKIDLSQKKFVEKSIAEPESLRHAVEFLAATYKERYPDGNSFLRKLDENLSTEQRERLCYEIAASHPVLRENRLVFVTRRQYARDHHNTGTDFLLGEVSAGNFRPGGAIRTLDLSRSPDDPNRTTTLLELPHGVARDLEVHFDANRILFSVRYSGSENFRIAELALDTPGAEPCFLGSVPEAADMDPIYLPDDSIVFSSTRDLKYCGCNQHAQANLFRMNGSHVRQIGRNTLYESRPSLMPDGRILYDRWEYVDRHFGPSFGLWTMYPDGRMPVLHYGNNAWSPGAIFDARCMPDGNGNFSPERIACSFGACHDRPWGAIVILDRTLGLDGMAPILHSWPRDIAPFMRNSTDYRQGREQRHPVVGQIDLFMGMRVKYEDPYPLDEAFLLCSRTLGNGERTGIFLIDIFGNEILLFEDPDEKSERGCFDPMPIMPRRRPPILLDEVDPEKTTGTFFVADIYRGTGMDRVPRGTIKKLRVVEAPPKRVWTGPLWEADTLQRPAMNYNCTNNKRILGEVPVEADGSVYVEVPSGRFVFFQALDAEGMMVQSMRTGTSLQGGENASCIGCHENRYDAPGRPTGHPEALKRGPRPLRPWYGPTRNFNYVTEVQPVWDRYCISCHDYGKEAEKPLNLSGDLGIVFNTSYMELRKHTSFRWYPDPADSKPKELIKPVDDGPPEVLPPYAWGARRSRLIEYLRGEHYDVKLDPESFDRVVTWLDLNTPYYGDYETDFPNHHFGRCPLDRRDMVRLAELTGVRVDSTVLFAPDTGTLVNFTRPEWSECLRHFSDKNDPKYREALKIIEKGRDLLERFPRPDAKPRPFSNVDFLIIR